MRTIIFAPETINLAETTRQIEIARACQDKFSPHFTSYGGKFQHFIEEAGFPLRELTPRMTNAKAEHLMKLDRMEALGQPFTEAELTERVRNELELFEQVKPVAVVMGMTLSVLISARAAAIPLVVVMPFAGTRPFYEAGLGTWPDAFDYLLLRWIPDKFLNWVMTRLALSSKVVIGTFNKVARTSGAPLFQRDTDLFEGDHTLVTDIPEVTGVSNLPPNHHYVGPIFARLDQEVPAEIRNLPRDRPIVYFAMGSSGNRAIVREIIQGFGAKPYRVIAPVQAHLEGMDVHIPENVLVTGWIPAHKVNPLAEISVIHGGQGTVQTACLSGTPIVGVGMQPEQEGNLDFLVRKGMAIRIRKHRVTARAVLDAVDRLLADEDAPQRAREVQQALQGWNGPGNVAQFLSDTFGGSAG